MVRPMMHMTGICMMGTVLLTTHRLAAQSIHPVQWTGSGVFSEVQHFIDEQINDDFFIILTGYSKKDSVILDSLFFDRERNELHVFFDEKLSYAPIRENTIAVLSKRLQSYLSADYQDSDIYFYADDKLLEEYIPNYFRSHRKLEDDKRKTRRYKRSSPPLVRNVSRPFDPQRGLYNINIALWHSHGWYYEHSLHRWEWQRARLFKTVEDLFPMAFTMHY
ncbi:unnamed protein product, partial [marine sediment metagenome]